MQGAEAKLRQQKAQQDLKLQVEAAEAAAASRGLSLLDDPQASVAIKVCLSCLP